MNLCVMPYRRKKVSLRCMKRHFFNNIYHFFTIVLIPYLSLLRIINRY